MYHPNVILVEKSVSRDIQESILAKGITLVFDMKLHRLERVARCIGSPVLASEAGIGQRLRQCDSFRIEKFVEEYAAPKEGGKKQSKTLMFLEGAPTRLACTVSSHFKVEVTTCSFFINYSIHSGQFLCLNCST